MNWFVRITLLILILVIGTAVALYAGETRGLALANLSNATVTAVVQPAGSNVLLTALSGEKHGIYRSDDGGRSWAQMSANPDGEISALAVHPFNPNIVFAGTSSQPNRNGGNLWYSIDGGRTWDDTLYGLPLDESGQAPIVSALAAAPDQPNLMYLGTWGQGLYRFDIRQGWMELLGGNSLANLYVNKLVVQPNSPIYAVTTAGLMRINGNQVESIKTPDGVVSMAIHPVNPKILYVGTVGYGLHRSTDGGQTWQSINNGLGLKPGVILRVPAIAIDSHNPQHLAVSTAFSVGSRLASDGIFESIDAGQSWKRVADVDYLADNLIIENGGIYAATTQGLTRYGQPLPQPEPNIWQRVESLASPTAVQAAILLITLIFGLWVLFARLSWVPAAVKKG